LYNSDKIKCDANLFINKIRSLYSNYFIPNSIPDNVFVLLSLEVKE